jgi:hypothetical protein
MWRLKKVSHGEMNQGQTTAFKRCSNVSEAKRFKRSLNELTNLQNSFKNSKTVAEGAKVIREFMKRFPRQPASIDEIDLNYMGTHMPKEELYDIGQKILLVNLMRIDP